MGSVPEDYTKVQFPYDTLCGGDTRARLLATDGNIVVGVLIYGSGEHEHFGQALAWNADGSFGSQGESYPKMDLPPPPARAQEMVAKIDVDMAAAQSRLSEFPDAPAEWRSRDENAIIALGKRREKILGVAA